MKQILRILKLYLYRLTQHGMAVTGCNRFYVRLYQLQHRIADL